MMISSDCDESDVAAATPTFQKNSEPLPEDTEPSAAVDDNPIMCTAPLEVIPPAEEVLAKAQYLTDCPTWAAFVGESRRSQYSAHFVSRNDKIWELLVTEKGYVEMLVMVRDVYLSAFPVKPGKEDSLDINDNLFPCSDELLAGHTSLLHHMLSDHNNRPDHVSENLGQCMLKALTETMVLRLTDAYGQLMFAQSTLTERLNKLKMTPGVADRIAACERDERTKRRTVTDCYLIILQRWTKIETLISSIMADTIVQDGGTELEDLTMARSAVQSILKGAQLKLTDLVYADKLCFLAANLQVDCDLARDAQSRMKAPKATLINYDKMVFHAQGKNEGSKCSNIDVHGVLLKDCFFLLRQDADTGKFSLYKDTKMPSILIWTKHFGYFREQAGALLSFIIIMDSKNSKPTLDRFTCATLDEVGRWRTAFKGGFDNFEEVDMVTLQENFNTKREAMESRRQRQEEKLDLISQLNAEISCIWDVRNTAYRALFVEEDPAATASRSASFRSTNAESSNARQSDCSQLDDEQTRVRKLHHRFIQILFRLSAVMGDGDSTSLSRSASDAADRRASYGTAMPPTPEGYSTLDNAKRRSEKDSNSRTKTKGRHRISSQGAGAAETSNRMSHVSNFLRTGSRGKGENGRRGDQVGDPRADDFSEEASDSSLSSTNPTLLIAETQELARRLYDDYEDCRLRYLKLEQDKGYANSEMELMGGQYSVNAKRELENLRSLQKKHEDEQKVWKAYKQKEAARIERDSQKNVEWATELSNKEKKYEEDCRTLQEQIDLHESRGVDVSRLKTYVSHSNLRQEEIERKPVTLNLTQSTRSERRPEISDRRQTTDSVGGPPNLQARVPSCESLNGRYGGSANALFPEPEPMARVPSTTSLPPAAPHQVGAGVPTVLPTKLASKSTSKSGHFRSFHRH